MTASVPPEGELERLLHELASTRAINEQERIELESARTELAVARTEVQHLQRQLADVRAHCASLEEQVQDALGQRESAERERAAIIATLGRRARQRLQRSS